MQVDFTGFELPQKGTLVFFVAKGGALSAAAADFDEKQNGLLTRAVKAARFKAAKAEIIEILAPTHTIERVVLVGLGDNFPLESLAQTHIAGQITAKLLASGSESAYLCADYESVDPLALAEGILARSYRFDKYRTKESDDKKPTLKAVTVGANDPKNAQAGLAARSAVIKGVHLTRDLTSEVPNILFPAHFAAEIEKLSALGLEIEILGEAEMKKLGMGALLGVGQGSARESKLAIMRWNGAGSDSAPVAFIGKGVTFDSGGISLKPGEGMDQMKWDMGGAGIVTGLMAALAGRKAKANVVGLVGLVENMPDGAAQRPGDVVTSMSGQTIEILNTDAEGRLVLADVLWYAQERFKPSRMIDLATLTGAIIISLGHEYAGLFANDDALADDLLAASRSSGDKIWRMPLDDAYDQLINTPTADMKNIGGKGAGSITAAQFLKRFTNDIPWAHIDVAGMVWADKDLPLSEKGATGFGVRLLDQFVYNSLEK